MFFSVTRNSVTSVTGKYYYRDQMEEIEWNKLKKSQYSNKPQYSDKLTNKGLILSQREVDG